MRVHADGEAGKLSRQLQAQAFTHQRDVYFAPGKYDPNSSAGKRLLAHELTHVVQQTGGQVQRKALADSDNGAATLSGVASGQALGDYPVELQVVDGLGLSATQSFTVTIVSATRAESGQHSDESARRTVLAWPGEPSLAGVASREQLPGNRRERASVW